MNILNFLPHEEKTVFQPGSTWKCTYASPIGSHEYVKDLEYHEDELGVFWGNADTRAASTRKIYALTSMIDGKKCGKWFFDYVYALTRELFSFEITQDWKKDYDQMTTLDFTGKDIYQSRTIQFHAEWSKK